jgi:hypothetical protein
LKGLDALDLLTVDHPYVAELLGLHLAILEKSVEVVDIPPSVFCYDYMGRKGPELDDFDSSKPTTILATAAYSAEATSYSQTIGE